MSNMSNFLGNVANGAFNAVSSTVNPLAAVGSLVGGIGSMITNAQRMNFERTEAEKQRQWSEGQTDKQNEWNLNMWNMANEYNTPSAQVERLRDAGLNPLYYGIDGVAASPMEAAQPLGYERASLGNMENPFGSAFDTAVQIAQLSNIRADTAKKTNETLTETTKREKMQVEIDEAKQEIKNKLATEKLTDVQRQTAEKALGWLDRINEASLAEKQADTALKDTQKKRIEELLEGEKLIQSKTIEDFDKRWQKIRAEIKKMAAETKLLEEDLENYALNHANAGFMGTGLSLPNFIRGAKDLADNGVKVDQVPVGEDHPYSAPWNMPK